MSEEYCHDCGQYYIKSTGLNYHFGCNVKRDKDYRCCDCWWSKAEIARLKAECADLKARLIEGPKKKLVMCERCKVVTDWYGLDRACKCGCPNFCDLDPKPQGEE